MEVLRRAVLAHERLHHAHAGDVLGERRRDEAEPLSHRGVRARRALAEEHGPDAHERDHRERGEREPPVEDEQEDRRAAERERALGEGRDAVRDELVDRLDIVRHPADQDAGPVALVEAERKPLQVAEQLLPQVGEDPLADPAGHVRLNVGHAPVREPGGEEDPDDEPEPRARVAVLGIVERVLREERRGERGRRRGEEREDGEAGADTVRPRQPPEHAEAPARRVPRPVLDLRGAPPHQVTAGLVNPHEAISSTSARASTASANWRSSRPCS